MSYTYYIYHIPGIKIGCTTDLTKRMQDQGFTNWEILWQQEGDYEFGWIAGENEIELQKLYDYKVDTVNYQVSRQNRSTWNNNTRFSLTKEDCIKGGKNGLGRKVENTENYRNAALNRPTRQCEICGNQVKVNVYKQHVNSHKKSL
jgi:hypothetical protein